MKTIKNITGFFCVSLLLFGCVENYDIPSKTEKGKAIYDSWHKGVDTVLSRYINIAFLFNTWHEAADSQKNSMEDKYLPQFKIRDLGGDQWGLYSGAELAYRIVRNNKSLAEADAFWIVETTNASLNKLINNDNQGYYSGNRYQFASFFNDEKTIIALHNTGTNQWDIQVGYSLSNVQMVLHLKSIDDIAPISLFESSFTMSLDAHFAYLGDYGYSYSSTYIDSKTTEDLVYRYQNKSIKYQENDYYSYPSKAFYWSAGKVSLNAIRSHNDKEDVKTEASFSRLTSSQFGIYITYKGITEEWIEDNR